MLRRAIALSLREAEESVAAPDFISSETKSKRRKVDSISNKDKVNASSKTKSKKSSVKRISNQAKPKQISKVSQASFRSKTFKKKRSSFGKHTSFLCDNEPLTIHDLEFDLVKFLQDKNLDLENGNAFGVSIPAANAKNEASLTDSTVSGLSNEIPFGTFSPGDLVCVLSRPGKGVRKQSGVGRVLKESDLPGAYDIKFSVGGRDRSVPTASIVRYMGVTEDFEEKNCADVNQFCDSICSNTDTTDRDSMDDFEQDRASQGRFDCTGSESWVRRSCRRAGQAKLVSVRVSALINRILLNEKTDEKIRVLRLKDFVDSNINKDVILRILGAIEKNDYIQALYIQNMEQGMDDETLAALANLLRKKRIWALNVGENFGISEKGWKKFADNLRFTYVTHMYAGSETTVYGNLKVLMRNAIRDNRAKHSMHIDPSNISVINQIGQMWWNPRNSKLLQQWQIPGRKRETVRLEPKIGNRISLFHNNKWRLGRIVNYRSEKDIYLVSWENRPKNEKKIAEYGAWFDLNRSPYLLSHRVCWVRISPQRDEELQRARKCKQSPQHKTVSLRTTLLSFIRDLIVLPAARPFLKFQSFENKIPREVLEAAGDPIDLRTIRRNVEKNCYDSVDLIQRDVSHLFSIYADYYSHFPHDAEMMLLKRWAEELLGNATNFLKTIRENFSRNPCVKTDQEAPNWEPVQVFQHSHTMPLEQHKENDSNEEIAVFFRSPLSWFWFYSRELYEYSGHEQEFGKLLDGSVAEAADLENKVFEHISRAKEN